MLRAPVLNCLKSKRKYSGGVLTCSVVYLTVLLTTKIISV